MAKRFDFGGVDLTAGDSPSNAQPSSETPFCMAILGDFSGRASRRLADPKSVDQRRAILVDRDNFDDVMSSLHVDLHLPTAEGVPIVFRFSELDDFHPDRLFEHPALAKLRALRKRMEDPSTFEEVARELGLSSSPQPVSQSRKVETSPVSAPSAVGLASGSLLDDMIAQTETRIATEGPARKKDEVHEFARQIAAKYAVSAPDPRRPEFVAAVDRAVADTMRTVLHNPDFQALEAIWRATFFLIRQLETGSRLKLYLFDISKAELAADLNSAEDVRNSGGYRLLVERAVLTPGADPWAVVVGNYSFGPGKEEMELLSRLAKVARASGAPFVAEANSLLLGTDSLAAAPHPREWNHTDGSHWDELRRAAEADSVALAIPRFLLRLPYGEQTSPTEAFEFEEFPGAPEHSGYLWGNPAFAVGLLLAESFSEAGWEMAPGAVSQIEKLPIHVYRGDGGAETKPCAEVLFTEDAVQAILERGLIPLVSYKGRDSVRVARFQSIADPPRPIRARWA